MNKLEVWSSILLTSSCTRVSDCSGILFKTLANTPSLRGGTTK
jgi:hypothetical protein